jgi:hypothetical protein
VVLTTRSGDGLGCVDEGGWCAACSDAGNCIECACRPSQHAEHKRVATRQEENIRKYDLICVSRVRDVGEIYEAESLESLVFFIFSEGLQSSCVYTARGRRK